MVLCALCGVMGAQTSGVSARIEGIVADEAGQPVIGAEVRYAKTRAYRIDPRTRRISAVPGQRQIRSAVFTGAGGTFQIADLPPGEYWICAEAKGFLDSCKWFGAQKPMLTAGAVLQLQANSIRLRRGAELRLRVEDPLALLPVSRHPLARKLVVGVYTAGGRFIGAAESARDAGGRTFGVTVPFDTPLKVWAFSRHVRLADDKGAALPSTGVRIPVQIPRGTAAATVTLRVTGEIKE